MKTRLALSALTAAVLLSSCGDIRSISSIKQVEDDNYLYTMNFQGKYDLDEVIQKDIDGNEALLSYVAGKISRGLYKPKPKKTASGEAEVNCTSFQAKNADGDGYLYGRNYDMFKNPTLVVTNHPEGAYASISTCDLSHLGYGMDKVPDKFKNKLFCLAAVYAPMDGMNEKGLCTSIMALPKQPAQQDSGKHKVGTSILMRLWLDRCATVDEALALLETVDVCHDTIAGSGYHYMVADASGDCAVVEFDLKDGWKTMITRKPDSLNAMHVTNHLLAEKYYTEEENPEYGNPHSKSWWRYSQVAAFLAAHNGILSREEAQECLSEVHWKDFHWENGQFVEDTQWSNVYDQKELKLYLRNWNSYDKTVEFGL